MTPEQENLEQPDGPATGGAQGDLGQSVSPAPARRIGGARRLIRSTLRVLLLALGPIIILTIGGFYYATSGRIIETENAYVKADHVLISPDVDGRVVAVHVRENQEVSVDTPLFEIDPWPYQIELERVEAELASVRFDVAAYRAAYRQAKAELGVVKRDERHLRKEFERRQSLAERSILPKSDLDDFRHQWEMSRQRVAAIHQKIVRTLASLGGDKNLTPEQYPRYQELLAKRNKAALALERTVVRAPAQGIVSNVDLQPGEYVEAGKPVFSLMSTSGLWIEANLKETQLTHVREGQQVKVQVDAYPGNEWSARVASLSPGTGAEFSLLPPQNATGNWVKVVQRVPVHIDIEPNPEGPRLRSGMSVTVDIDTGFERPLPGFVASALAIVGYAKREHGTRPPSE